MDISKISITLEEILKTNHYQDLIKLLSFAERKYIFDNILELHETHVVLEDEKIYKYFFTKEEVDILYKDINKMNDIQKHILGMNTDILKKQIIKQINDENCKIGVIVSLEKDEDKLEFIDDIKDIEFKSFIIKNLNNPFKKVECLKKNDLPLDYHAFIIQSIKDDNALIELITYYNSDAYKHEIMRNFTNAELLDSDIYTDAYKYEVIRNFMSDELKIKYLDTLNSDIYKLYIVKDIKDNEFKLQFIKNMKMSDDISFNNALIDVIKSTNDDIILKNIDKFEGNDYYIGLLLCSLNSDELKLKIIPKLGDNQGIVYASIKDEDLKIKNLHLLTNGYGIVIKSIKNIEKRFELINDHINKVFIYDIVHMDDLDKIKNIYPNIIKTICNYYQVNKDNLTSLITKYSYDSIKFLGNQNIIDMLNLNKEDFNKIITLFDSQKSHQLNMIDVDNIIASLLQREFRFSNNDVISAFTRLERLIENKNILEIKKELNLINESFNIYDVLNKYKISYDNFINGLIDRKYINILHEITDNYISLKRDEYLRNNQEKVKKELNLESSYEKNYLLDKMFKYYDIDKIYNLIISLDKSTLNKEQLELINNKELLIKTLTFRKNPKEYSGVDVKNKIKLLNQILTQLYLSKKINYLGYNDKDAKVIYNVKKTNQEEYLKIMSELNIQLLKDKILDNEMYDELLSIIKTYHFLGWNDIFNALLIKADLVFDNTSISVLVNNFYEIYPKLEEKVKLGLLKNISLTTLIDEISTYGSDSLKYKYLLGKNDYQLFLSNPTPNASFMTKEERLELLPLKMKQALDRKYITIPPIDEDIVVNNKKINARINSFIDPINFTYGERTGSCMRIGGAGKSLFDFCLTNESGFHISFNGDNFVSRVSGFRNGNTVFLNQLRYSTDTKYTNEDLYEAIKEVAKILVDKTKDSPFPIKNVVISADFVMKNYSKERTSLSVNPKEGLENFYSDINENNAIFLIQNEEIKLGNNVERYEVPRKRIKYFTEYEDIKNALQQIKIIDGLIKDEDIANIELFDDEILTNITSLYVGEDWFIGINKNNEIIKYILERNELSKEKAIKEMDFILNKLDMGKSYKEDRHSNRI